MKKTCIIIAALFSSLVFCTKNDVTQVSQVSGYTDSITIDLFSYSYYCFKHNTSYYDSAAVTAKGQLYLKPLDSSVKTYNSTYYAVVPPKYEPREFEAWLYDSIPLTNTVAGDTNLLLTGYSFSSFSYLCLDTSTTNSAKDIQSLAITYNYGYGFVLGISGTVPLGVGKIKIYYK